MASPVSIPDRVSFRGLLALEACCCTNEPSRGSEGVGVRTPISVESILPCPASVAFEAALQPATFIYVTLGMLGMPALCGRELPFEIGETVSGRIFLGNLIPLWGHEIEIVDIDPESYQLVSHERGGLVHQWHHTVDVEPMGAGECRLRDTVQIDAGGASGLVTAWARSFYHYRHRRWQRMVAAWGYPAAHVNAS